MSAKLRAPRPETRRHGELDRGDPFAPAFRAARTAMVLTDPRRADNPIAFANDAFSRLTGYSRQEATGRNCRFLQGPETDARTVDRIRAALTAGEGIETEILNYRKDGSRFWNLLVISPIRSEANELLYFFASQFDVSEKKNAEFELTRTKALLEEQVLERTQDLQSALDQKTALLHEVDHRVKNNLQVISSLVLLKARRMREPAAQHALQNLSERISALSTVHRLLYSAGDVSRFDLSAFLDDLTEDLSGLLPPGQVALDLAVEPVAVPAAQAAPLALLLNEVVSNAFKHAYPDHRRGRLQVQVTKPPGALRIVVEDDGIGMDGVAPPGSGFGKTLIDTLARQLKARVDWNDAQPGTRAVITMPLEAEEPQF